MHEQETKFLLQEGEYNRLKEQLGEPLKVERLVDHYWDLNPRALRLRESELGAAVTVKGPKLPGPAGITVREEWERAVAPEYAAFMAALFDQLGFKPLATIVKHRRTYQAPGLVLALDRVEGLGDFFEIELTAEGSLEQLQIKAQELGLQQIEPKSYLELWLAHSPRPR